ncbi:MAG: hypothetical protein KA120_07790 [Candidatus Goldbacteria bacterium]|nr:hypothetical protein [Candidatus Goldiibacteriota bacterium]
MQEIKKSILISLIVVISMICLLILFSKTTENIILKFLLFGIIFFIGLINLNWKSLQKRDKMFALQKLFGIVIIGLLFFRPWVNNFGLVIDAITGIILALWIVTIIKMFLVWNK